MRIYSKQSKLKRSVANRASYYLIRLKMRIAVKQYSIVQRKSSMYAINSKKLKKKYSRKNLVKRKQSFKNNFRKKRKNNWLLQGEQSVKKRVNRRQLRRLKK
jgi:hypothetical protein